MGLLEIAHPAGLDASKILVEATRGPHLSCQNTTLASAQPAVHDGDEDAFAVLSLRNLLFDICNQNGGGHGGSAIGMAAIGVALFKHTMRYNPSNPDWFDRDRFVLSNGEP